MTDKPTESHGRLDREPRHRAEAYLCLVCGRGFVRNTTGSTFQNEVRSQIMQALHRLARLNPAGLTRTLMQVRLQTTLSICF